MNAGEKAEFEVMKNEITHIKTDVTEIKGMLKEHVEWEAKKYQELDGKYATKEKVKQLETKFDTWNKTQDLIITSGKEKIWDITIRLLPYLLFGTILALMKYGPGGI